MNRTAAALFVSAGVCAGLLAASPSWAQAMGGPYASYNNPYGTYSAYPTSGYPYTNAYGYPYTNAYGPPLPLHQRLRLPIQQCLWLLL